MPLLKPSRLLCWALLFSMHVFAQEKQDAQVRHKHPNIVLHTIDQKKFKGMVENIGPDYLVFDAAPYQSAMQLNEYYLRRTGDYYQIDAVYIQHIQMRKGRAVKKAAIGGAIACAILFGGLAYESSASDGNDFFTSSWHAIVGGGAGIVVGGVGGAIIGLFSRKHIRVNGSPAKFREIELYYSK